MLDHVLRLVPRAQHVPTEGEDRRAVPLKGHLERGLVAGPDLLNQPIVAGEGEQPP